MTSEPHDRPDRPQVPIDRLLWIMARLRDPEHGCPWDVEQTFATIAPHTIEEAYEVADAIRLKDMEGLRDELGDLLFQVVFYAQMGAEDGTFTFDDIVEDICNKMIQRHPHVFGSTEIAGARAQMAAWENRKAEERRRKAVAEGRRPSLLDGVALGLPGLTRAVKLGARAARGGFDWPDKGPVIAKIREELEELEDALASGESHERLAEELGDLLFATANLARHLEAEPEGALRDANAKFENRFRRIEDRLAEQGRQPLDATLEEMEELWRQGKLQEENQG